MTRKQALRQAKANLKRKRGKRAWDKITSAITVKAPDIDSLVPLVAAMMREGYPP